MKICERKSSRGFTLLELIVVLSIVAIAVSLVLPSIGSGIRHWRLRGAVREVATLLKFARNQSVVSTKPLHVILDRSRSLYWLDNADASVLAHAVRSDQRKIRLYALPDGIRFGDVAMGYFGMEPERLRIVFFPRGSSTGGEVQILDEGGRGYQIRVDSLTGRAGIVRMES